MKKINYFNKEMKEDVDFSKELNEDSFEIKPQIIQIEDSQLDYYLNIINTSYGDFGKITVEEEDISKVRQNKINEINSICEDKIINEFYSICLGEKKRFDCTLTDQSNIMGLVAKAQMILSNITTDTTLDWKASEEPICYPWTPTQILTLGMDLFTHKTEKIKRFELLRSYINTLTTVEEINQVNWDTEIPPEANTQTSSQEGGTTDVK